MNKLIPSLICKYKPITFIKNNNYLVQIKNTLDQYDYNLNQQQTPIIYFGKYDDYLNTSSNNHFIIKDIMKSVLPEHKVLFWKKEHPKDNLVIDTDKYVSLSHHDYLRKQIYKDIILTRIWYENNPKRIDVLMENGNFTLDYLHKINNPHRFYKIFS